MSRLHSIRRTSRRRSRHPPAIELLEARRLLSVPTMVKDIVPGPGSSLSTEMVPYGDLLYFFVGGVWRSDGTEAGTFKLNGSPSYLHKGMVASNGRVFFFGQGYNQGVELWAGDGQQAYMVKDIFPGPSGQGIPLEGAELGDNLVFFAASSQGNYQLWRTDGTEAGTSMVSPVRLGNSPFNCQFTVVDSVAYFCGNDDAHGTELWRTDGTESGTYMVKDLAPGPTSTAMMSIEALGNQILVSGTFDQKAFVWASDGTEAGTVPVADVTGSHVLPDQLVAAGGLVYFAAGHNYSGNGHLELWATDGTPAGTYLVKSIGKFLVLLGSANGKLYFGPLGTKELWISDGTESGTHVVRESLDFGARTSRLDVTPRPERLTLLLRRRRYPRYRTV
jgi:ELWxxDGT repeat protein